MLKITTTGQLVPSGKVIKSEVFAAKVSAQDIVLSARQKANKIIQDSQAIYEKEKQRGFNEGLEGGKAEASQLMMELLSKSVDNFEKSESDIIRIVSEALKRIVGEMNQGDLITQVVKNALKVIRNQKRALIRVCPSQAKILQTRIAELSSDNIGAVKLIEIVPDNRLKENQCILETEMGIIDASIQTQLDAIQRIVVKSIK
jgi:type III secretion protein L